MKENQKKKVNQKNTTTTTNNNAGNTGNTGIELVLDVAGGHGALGALLLTILPTVKRSTIIDPAQSSSIGSVELAWGEFYKKKNDNETATNANNDKNMNKELTYRHECLRTGLRQELEDAIHTNSIHPSKILVVACHACQHLSDETLEIACSYGVHVAVMPCCHKDLSGGSYKSFGTQIGMNIGMMMDILTAGKVMSWNNGRESGVKYQVKMKLIDEKITPHNRVILCKATNLEEEDLEKEKIRQAHEKLTKAYHRAHNNAKEGVSRIQKKIKSSVCVKSLGIGLAAGVLLSIGLSRRR
jgi:hypothetical protein